MFPCPIQVNNGFLPNRVFTSFRIKTVGFQMILICGVVFGHRDNSNENSLLTDKPTVKPLVSLLIQ